MTGPPSRRATWTGFVAWLAAVLASRHVPAASGDVALATYDRVLGEYPRAQRILAHGRRVLPSGPAAAAAEKGEHVA